MNKYVFDCDIPILIGHTQGNPYGGYSGGYKGGQGLHHLDGVGAHTVAVVEVLGHAEDHHVVLLLREGHVGAPVGDLPASSMTI